METLPEDSSARDLFFRALELGTVEELKAVVRLGANVNWRKDTEAGPTGILTAVVLGSLEKLEFLLSMGADVNQVDKLERTPLMAACAIGLPDMVERYESHPASSV